MGTDKGLLKLDTVTWAQTAAHKMALLQIPVVLSVNNEQYPNYPAFFPAEKIIKDNEAINVKGPMRGVLSVHATYPEEDLFVLACDMPLMETAVLEQLLGYYKIQTADAFVYTNDGTPEPLCGIYCASGSSHILQLQKKNQLLKYSMKYMLEQMKTISIPLAADQKKYFRNFNAHTELNGL